MCGIVGYVGPREAVSFLVEGLARLEYRGYDSAGVAVLNGRGVETRKLAGRIAGLRELLARAPVHGRCGIGLTRWATHGAPTERNAHPHSDCTRTVALVHNGIIENADVLRKRLEQDGHRFATETDTETLVHLIEESPGAPLEERIIATLDHVEGTYGIAVVAESDPGKIVVARRGSPVLLGVGDGEFLVASDASAVLGHTRSVVYLNDGDVAVVTAEGYRVLDREARVQERAVDDIEWDLDAIALDGYPHFMLKEICEQAETVRSTLRGRLLVAEGTARLNGLNLTAEQCGAIRRIVIVACGTSWHAGLVGRHVLEELTGIPVSVESASGYRSRRQVQLPGTVTIAISQSGETADTLEALRAAKATGSTVLGLVNVVGSTIARETDGGLYLHAGPEIGVASTKAFTCQCVVMTLLALFIGRRKFMSQSQCQELIEGLCAIPDQMEKVLEQSEIIKTITQQFCERENWLFLGRGYHYPIALEGALKLKEISYIHAEGMPTAEMKHGPIALINEGMPVVFLAMQGLQYDKVISNIEEVRARGGKIIAVATEGDSAIKRYSDHVIYVPDVAEPLQPILSVVPLQLLAYHAAVARGCNVDTPRTLAESVTVE